MFLSSEFRYYYFICLNVKSFRISKRIESLFKGVETESKLLLSGGISTSGDFVVSDYFSRLRKLGDFRVATEDRGGYPYPYLDFGITEIYQKLYFVIGMIFLSHLDLKLLNLYN